MANMTQYAKKYGVPEDAFGLMFGEGKSGLTPLSPFNPFTKTSPYTNKVRDDIESYQKKVFYGFTTRELVDLDIITERQLHAISINAPIHPIFRQDRWETRVRTDYTRVSLYTLPGKLVGGTQNTVWVAHHPVVWAALVPSLRLASVMIENLHKHPWFDALMMAPREDIGLNRFPPEAQLIHDIGDLFNKHKTFRPRPASKVGNGEAKAKMEQLIRDVLDTRLTFDFMSIDEDTRTGDKYTNLKKVSGQFHVHIPPGQDAKMYISLAFQDLMPLLGGQSGLLNNAEILADQFTLAVTLVHEVVHAIHYANQNFDGPWLRSYNNSVSEFVARCEEPYFDIEQEAELGRSAEQSLFGGMIQSVNRNSDGAPHIAFAAMTFPQAATNVNNSNTPNLIMPSMTEEGFAIPIPATFFENICSQAYWDVHVRKFGVEGGLKLSQVVSAAYSKKVTCPPGFDPPYRYEWRRIGEYTTDEYRLKLEVNNASLKSLSSMTPEQRKEHAEIMKRDVVADLHQLFAQRDDLVDQVITAGEYIMINGSDDKLYEIGIKNLLRRLKELLDMHHQIINQVPEVEARAGQSLPEVRASVLTFHSDLRKHASFFFNADKEPGKAGMERLVAEIDDVDIDDAFIRMPISNLRATLEDETYQDLLLEEAKIALENGDHVKCREACFKITKNLNSSLHYIALARIQLALVESTSMNTRISLLKRAVKLIDSLDMKTVPGHLSIKGVRAAAADIQARLEAQEIANTGGLICSV